MKRIILCVLSCSFLLAGLASAHTGSNTESGEVLWTSGRPDGHAPIGVMGDHVHDSGEWMLSYRYMQMYMAGNRDGTDDISINQVHSDFMVAPTEMTTRMHMFGGMYALSDTVTLMAMVPYVQKSMAHVTRGGTRFTTKTEGFGDLSLSALYVMERFGSSQWHMNFGFSLPTGSIDEVDATPADPTASRNLPYPMQLGTGTPDVSVGATYLKQWENQSVGAQGTVTVPLGENDNDYTVGETLEATLWYARPFTEELSGSVRARGLVEGNIDGSDPDLNPNMVPTADPDRRGKERLDLFVGLNTYQDDEPYPYGGQRLNLEVGFPVYQSLDGPQLESDWMVTVGWQW